VSLRNSDNTVSSSACLGAAKLGHKFLRKSILCSDFM